MQVISLHILLVIWDTVAYYTSDHTKKEKHCNDARLCSCDKQVCHLSASHRNTCFMIMCGDIEELLLHFAFPAAASWTLLQLLLRGGSRSLCLWLLSKSNYINNRSPLPKTHTIKGVINLAHSTLCRLVGEKKSIGPPYAKRTHRQSINYATDLI